MTALDLLAFNAVLAAAMHGSGPLTHR